MSFKTYVYHAGKVLKDDRDPPEYFWWETEGGRERVLSEEEALAIRGYKETWTVHILVDHPDMEPYRVSQVTVEVCESGWSCPSIYPPDITPSTAPSSLLAAQRHAPGGVGLVQRLIRPDGSEVDILRFRFVTGDLITEVGYPYTQEALDSERWSLGTVMDAGSKIGWCYANGALYHARDQNPKGRYAELKDEDYEVAELSAIRAQLAVLRAFRCYPIRKYLWKNAPKATYRVEMRWNNQGPWAVVDEKGLPQ